MSSPNPQQKLGVAFAKLLEQFDTLPSPQRIVDILNILSYYQVRPIQPVITANLWVFKSTPLAVQRRIGAILAEGYEVNEALRRNASLIGETPMSIHDIISKWSN